MGAVFLGFIQKKKKKKHKKKQQTFKKTTKKNNNKKKTDKHSNKKYVYTVYMYFTLYFQYRPKVSMSFKMCLRWMFIESKMIKTQLQIG